MEVNMTTTSALGIDIAKANFDVALRVERRHYQATFKNNVDGFGKLLRWLKKSRAIQLHACMEATGRYGEALALFLYEQGHKVSVVNPARIKKYADSQLRRNKTDAQDAAIILDFCLTQHPPQWKPPSPQQRTLQELVRYHDSLKKMRQQEKNRLSSGLQVLAVISQIQQHLAYLEEQLAILEAQIQGHIEQFPELKRDQDLLISIPGIGKLTAARLLAEISDIRSFSNAKQLAAYAGLTPSHHISGSSIRKRPRMSKVGNSNLRRYLYMPALAAICHNPVIAAFRERLLARGKEKMVVVGAATRKLLHIVYGVLKSGRPFDPNHAVQSQNVS
jgi:transposase